MNKRKSAVLTALLTAALLTATVHSDSVPTLDPCRGVNKSEGLTDHRIYPHALGTLKTVMLFVDFPDTQAELSTEAAAEKILGGSKAQDWFKEQSGGKMELAVDIIGGWRRLDKNAGEYTSESGGFDTFILHKNFFEAACALYPEVNFGSYDMVYVVPPKTRDVLKASAFCSTPGTGAKTATGEVSLGVTFGFFSYRDTRSYTTLIHETGHILGLPDLYAYSGGGHVFGPWDMMCNIFSGSSFIGWHRHKLGWLADDRKMFLNYGTAETTLTPLPGNNGVSMIVVPAKGPDRHFKVFVIELAQPVYAKNGEMHGDGVLIYSIDARNPTGKFPAILYPWKKGNSPTLGKLYQAPFQAGTVFDDPDAPMTVDILSKTESNYTVKVTVKK